MAHLVRVRSSGAWYWGYKPTGQNLRDLDQNTYVAINGDEGGTWATAAAIIINGAGVVIAGPWTVAGAGGTSGVFTDMVNKYTITFNKGDKTDYFQVPNTHPFATQTLMTPAANGYSVNDDWVPVTESSSGSLRWGMRSKTHGSSIVVPLRVFDGFTVSKVTFRFAVTEAHANVPDSTPLFRAFAVDTSGTIYPLRAADSTTSPDGFIQMTAPANGGLYTNSSANQNLDYVCNQNNLIDCSKYSYFGEFIDESGTNSWSTFGTLLVGMASLFQNISLMNGRN